MTATATKQARTLVSRAVIWAGLALGTFLTVLAVMNGIRVPRLEVVLSVLATWALLTVLAVVVVELLRRHHRAIGRHAARYGKRGAAADRQARSPARRDRAPVAGGQGRSPLGEPGAPAPDVPQAPRRAGRPRRGTGSGSGSPRPREPHPMHHHQMTQMEVPPA